MSQYTNSACEQQGQSSKKTLGYQFIPLPRRALELRRQGALKDIDVLVLCELLEWRGEAEESCWTTRMTLARSLGVSEETIKRSLRRLKAANLVRHVEVGIPDPSEPRNSTGWRFYFAWINGGTDGAATPPGGSPMTPNSVRGRRRAPKREGHPCPPRGVTHDPQYENGTKSRTEKKNKKITPTVPSFFDDEEFDVVDYPEEQETSSRTDGPHGAIPPPASASIVVVGDVDHPEAPETDPLGAPVTSSTPVHDPSPQEAVQDRVGSDAAPREESYDHDPGERLGASMAVVEGATSAHDLGGGFVAVNDAALSESPFASLHSPLTPVSLQEKYFSPNPRSPLPPGTVRMGFRQDRCPQGERERIAEAAPI